MYLHRSTKHLSTTVFRCMATLTATALAAGSVACSEEDEPLPRSLVAVVAASTDVCPNGGQTVLAGTDDNGNGTLETAEVDSQQSVCAGAPGATGDQGVPGTDALVRTTDEPAGMNCLDGGVRVDAGIDADGSGTLESGEIAATAYACDGADGAAGVSSAVRTSTNTGGQCEVGGVRVQYGLDFDGDGVLSDAEVRTTDDVCNAEAGFEALVVTSAEPAGINCSIGGTRIESGIDQDRSGVLESAEVEDTTYVCDPIQTIARLVETSTTVCPNGGSRIETGADLDRDGLLSDPEVLDSAVVCAGAGNASRPLATITVEAVGVNCADGGIRIDSGFDTSNDGTLQPDEIDSTTYACSGFDGFDGSGGNASRVAAEPPGSNCAEGGVRVQTGPDTNENGMLDDGEVANTSYACNSQGNATLAAVSEEPAGENCTDGGRRIDIGRDLDRDDELDVDEIASTNFVCDTPSSDVPFAITTQAIPTALQGIAFSTTIDAFGGTNGSYTWQVSAGTLPAGLTLEPSGTPSTTLSGTATSTGTFTFTIKVTDFFGASAERDFAFTVDVPPCSPGSNGMVGSTITRVPSSISVTTEYYVAADGNPSGFVYVGGTSAIERIPKAGGTVEDIEALAGLGTGNLGYEMLIDGNDIYTIDNTTSGTDGRVFLISRDGGATFNNPPVDAVSFPTAPADDFRAVEVYDGRIYLMTHEGTSAPTEVWSFPSGAPTPATARLEVAFSDRGFCSGLAVDDAYFYAACGTSDELVRVDRLTGDSELLTADFDLSTTNNSMYGVDLDGDGSTDILYVHGWTENGFFVCDPGGVVFVGEHWSFGTSTSNYGMGFDRSTRLFAFDDGTDDVIIIE